MDPKDIAVGNIYTLTEDIPFHDNTDGYYAGQQMTCNVRLKDWP